MEIAPMTNYGCLQRGLSIMRLALGYKKGLPKDWWLTQGGSKNGATMADELRTVLSAFPKHHVRIICSDIRAKAWGLKRHEYHKGPSRKHIARFDNTHIFAISYMHNAAGESHFMVASPTRDMMPLTKYIMSVSIKERK